MSGIIQAGEGRASGLIKAAGGSGSVVTWQTGDIKTGNFSAVANQGFFCDTTSSAFTGTLPGSATRGDFITFVDYAGTFDTNNLTIGRNSHPIQGAANNLTVSIERAAFTLVYVDSTQGWLLKTN